MTIPAFSDSCDHSENVEGGNVREGAIADHSMANGANERLDGRLDLDHGQSRQDDGMDHLDTGMIPQGPHDIAFQHTTRRKPVDALVAYGSETGNSIDIAEQVIDILERHHIITKLVELDAVDITWLKSYSLIVIVTSTHGDGQVPVNARRFWAALKQGDNELSGVTFCIFGLGDRKYQKYCWAAKLIYRAMVMQGAKLLESLASFGSPENSDEEYQTAFKFWSVLFKQALIKHYLSGNGRDIIPDDVYLRPKWELDFSDDDHKYQQNLQDRTNIPIPTVADRIPGSEADGVLPVVDEANMPRDGGIQLVVTQNKRITTESTAVSIKDVRHFKFEKVGNMVEYGPMDVLSIIPKNPIADVESLVEKQGWQEVRNRPVKFVPTEAYDSTYAEPPIKELPDYPNLTVAKILTHYLNINGIPRQSFLRKLAEFAGDKDEETRLKELASPEEDDVDDFYNYAVRVHRSMSEVLDDFPSVKIPWPRIVDVFPLMQPRDFSIASGGRLKTDATGTRTTFELCVDMVRFETLRRDRHRKPVIREGVCSRYLRALLPGAKANAVLKRTQWRLKQSEIKQAHIMVSCGTGIAPLRSLLYENATLAQTLPGGIDPAYNRHGQLTRPRNVLIQGHRHPDLDWLFHDEWNREILPTYPVHFDAAFSRGDRRRRPPSALEGGVLSPQDGREYVQARMRSKFPRGSFCSPIMYQTAVVYICGKAGSFPDEVERAIRDDFVATGFVPKLADFHIRQMKSDGRWRVEAW